MEYSKQTIQADFDRIALLTGEGLNHNAIYHRFLLHQLPAHCAHSLEVGCGAGEFSRLLAERSDRVWALDLSPQMIGLARQRSAHCSNIVFEVADVTEVDLPGEQFDCIASIATLHHLPLEEMLLKLQHALKPGGVLCILDLFQAEGPLDLLTNAVALPVAVALRLFKTGRLRPPREVRKAWEEHGRKDRYLTLSRVRQICAGILPGAVVQKHLLWRYSIVWRKKE